MSLQQQLQDLSQQIADLSKQVEQSSAQALPEDTINYEQLIKLAKQRQFTGHLADKQDSYIKTVYMQTLFSVVNQAEEAIEDRLLLATCIADSMGAAENIRQYVTKSYTLTEQDMTDFLVVMKEQQLIEAFALDALMIIGIHLEKVLMQNVIALMSLLEIPETHFVEICQLTNALLNKNYYEINQSIKTQSRLKFYSQHYLKVIFKEIFISDNENCHLSEIINKDFTESILLKNSTITFEEKEIFKNLKRIYFENCMILGESIDVEFKSIEKITFKNIDFKNAKSIKQIIICDSSYVQMQGLIIEEKDINSKYPIKLQKCKEFIFKENIIKNNIVNNSGLSALITAAFHRGNSFQENRAFIKCEDVSKINEEKNEFSGNYYDDSYRTGYGTKKEKLEQLIRRHDNADF